MPLTMPLVPRALRKGPAWQIAQLFPDQGDWDEEDYLLLNGMTNRFVELVDGRVEVLEMPKKSHQRRAAELRDAIKAFCEPRSLGEVLLGPCPVRTIVGRYREPDVLFAFDPTRLGEDFGEKPDLVAEVVSSDRGRDLVKKRREYAAAGIPEYWIIDAEKRRVIVLTLKGGRYVMLGEYGPGDRAPSKVLKGFDIDAALLLA